MSAAGGAPTHCVLDGPDADGLIAAVAAWARPFLCGDAPVFGSAEWNALPVQDQRRAAAVVRAALAWWRIGEPLEDLEARAEAAEDKATAVAIAAGLADSRGADLDRATSAEIARWRDWGARRDRPDHPGGPVPVWGPEERRAAG